MGTVKRLAEEVERQDMPEQWWRWLLKNPLRQAEEMMEPLA
jgi:hypothetical protein